MRVEDREKAGIAPSNPKLRPPPNPSATVFVANVSGEKQTLFFTSHIISLSLCVLQLDYSLTWQKLRDIFRVAGKTSFSRCTILTCSLPHHRFRCCYVIFNHIHAWHHMVFDTCMYFWPMMFVFDPWFELTKLLL